MLNQNYEPLTVTTARRAIVLMFQGKAEMIVSADGLKIRSVSREFALPSIVRLWQYKKVPYRRVILSRKNILVRDRHQCQYCGTTRGPMTVDHVVPRTKNGGDTWENMVCACIACNNKKGHRSAEKAGMKLLRRPFRPTPIDFIQRYIGVSDYRWRPYLFMD
jgi:5-methylcytosine-specific restriction endonuclease McrA